MAGSVLSNSGRWRGEVGGKKAAFHDDFTDPITTGGGIDQNRTLCIASYNTSCRNNIYL